VGQYCRYLADYQPVFYDTQNPIGLRGCSYLHNYLAAGSDPLFAPQYAEYVADCPIFMADDVDSLVEYLRQKLVNGDEQHTVRRILEGRFAPSKKLLAHIAKVLDGKPDYVLLDEQLVAFDRVMAVCRDIKSRRGKTIVLIRGGPGTGKSVIALNLLARLSSENLFAHYVTGSRAFTQTLRKIVGSRIEASVTNFSSYMQADPEWVDVLICDEAHRMWERSRSRQHRATGKLQIEELLNACRAAVFFIDDRQTVRPDEIGSADYVIEFANKNGYRLFDYQLEAQFRCAGSAEFIRWIENTLELERTPNVLWNSSDKFELAILDSPQALDDAVRKKVTEGYSARVVAGFCWPWSDPKQDGTLVDDVTIGEFRRPWNAKPDGGRIARGIPRAALWAYDPKGVNQVGCVYTAQGFEFDYVGVIVGTDLVYRPGIGWVGQPQNSFDRFVVQRSGDAFADYVKNTYRVLFSRAMKGCFVYFVDRPTEDFVRSRIENIPAIPSSGEV
jgi:hypothetical protein